MFHRRRILVYPAERDSKTPLLHAFGEHRIGTFSCILFVASCLEDLFFRAWADAVHRRRPRTADIFHDPDLAYDPRRDRRPVCPKDAISWA